MATKIRWTDETWNPVIGCSKCSPGCAHCYAERMAARLARMEKTQHLYAAVVEDNGWNGKTLFHFQTLEKPGSWRKPRRVFVCSMGDLFHDTVSKWDLDSVFAIMALNPRHTFQLLTKRPDNMRRYLSNDVTPCRVLVRTVQLRTTANRIHDEISTDRWWPLPNVWIGTTVCNQAEADRNLPLLLDTPAAVRFVSIEPMLGPVDLARYLLPTQLRDAGCRGLDWVICGGESGPGARPLAADWVRTLREQCHINDVPFFFKQWGDRLHASAVSGGAGADFSPHGGNRLDGMTWEQFPMQGAALAAKALPATPGKR